MGWGRAGMQNKVGFDQVRRRVATDQLVGILAVLGTQDEGHDATTDISGPTATAATAAVTNRRASRGESFIC